ncbi:MAG: DUF2306 domain-containing protein [Paracoccaceae bacterium]
MPRKTTNNWKIITLLLLMGAIPSLPGTYIVISILLGPPADGSDHAIVRMHYFLTPVPVVLHCLAGFIFAALMPFQFSQRLRQRAPNWHRRSGRATLVSVFLLALTAFWMIAIFPPSGGPLKTASLAVTGVGIIVTFSLSLRAILRRDIATHRAWMMRGIAVTYGAVPSVLIYLGWFLLLGEPPLLIDELGRWGGMAFNLAVVEWVLHRKTRSPLKITQGATQ